MKRIAHGKVIVLFVVSFICSNGDDDRCPDISCPEDDLVWSTLNDNDEYQSWFRDEFENRLVLHEEDWDEGWGWAHLENHMKAFSKMYTAARVLYSGLGLWGSGWMARSISINMRYTPLKPSNPVLSFDNEGKAHVFVRDGAGQLIHIIYDPYKANPNETIIIENISQMTSSTTSSPMFRGNVALVKGPTSGRMLVLGLSDDTQGNVILFEQLSEGSTGAWSMTMLNPTEIIVPYSYGPLLMGNPIVLQESPEIIHVFGVNSDQYLVEYAWNSNGGIYIRQRLDSVPPKWKISKSMGSIAGMYIPETGLHIFAINKPKGDLIHFVCSRGQWKSENLTDLVGSEYLLDTNSTLVVQSPGSGHLTVFGRKTESDGELLRYSFKKIDLLNGNQIWTWQAQNITQRGENLIEPQGYLVQPVKIEPGFTTLHHDRVFGFDWRHNFVSFIYSEGQWRQICHVLFDISTYLPDWDKSDRLVAWPVAVSDGSVQRIYGVNTKNMLVEYKNFPPSMSWSVGRIPLPPGEYASNFWMKDLMVDAKRHPNGELHIVGIRRDIPGLVHFSNTPSHAWHNTLDYINWASGKTQDAEFHYEPSNSYGHDAYAYAGWFRSDRVEMWCPSFGEDYGPARRAAIMLHEATHIKLGDWVDVLNGDHDPKDRWFHHGLDDIPWGTLDPRTDGHRHSMYQIQVEFLSDIAEFPSGWIPLTIIQSSRNSANAMIDNKFSNTVGWKVGEPRPF